MASNPADAPTPTLPSSQYGPPSTHVLSSSSSDSESTVGATTAMLHDNHAPPLPVLTKVASDQWHVQVYFTGRAYPIGVFNSQLEATAAYEKAKERSGAFKEEFLDFPSSSSMELEHTREGVNEHIDLLRHAAFLDIKSKWDEKKRERNDSMMEVRNKTIDEAPIKRSHLSDREVQGALLSLAEKVSAEVVKEGGSASHLKGTPTMQAGLEDASSKDIPAVAKSIAASPKRGAHTKRKVPEDNRSMAMKIKRARRECKVPDCSKWSVKGGVCCRHGAKKVRRLCNNEGCMKLAQIGGVCVRHRSKIINGPPTTNTKAIVAKPPIAPGGGGLDLLCSALGFMTKVQEGDVHVPEKNTEQVDIRGGIVHAATAENYVVEECYSNDIAFTEFGLCSTNNVAEGKCVIKGYTNVEGQEEPAIMYPLGDDNEDDELGALVYNSSCTAKVRADIAQSSSAFARHEFRHDLACNPNSLLIDSPKSDSDCTDEDVKHPTSLGILGDSKDMTKVKPDNIKEPKKSSDLKEAKKRAKKSNATNNISKPKAVTKEKGRRPFNRYNIYFIFERENLIQSKGGSTPRMAVVEKSELVKEGYDNLDLPPLPSRFAHLNIPDGWYIPRSQKRNRRPHRKTHGVATFQELAKLIAANWKTIDNVTLEWTMEVEKILKENQSKLTRQALGIAKEAVTKKDKIDTQIKKKAVAKKKKAKNRAKTAKNWAKKPKADRKIEKKAAQVQAVTLSVAKISASYDDTDFAENMTASPKNSARDDHFVHPTPASTTCNQGMLCTDLKSPSPVTSGKGAATPDTSGNDSASSKYAGQLKCYATLKNDGHKVEKYNADHIFLESRAGVLPSHLEGYSQPNEELRSLMANNSGYEPIAEHAGQLRGYSALNNGHEDEKSFAEHVGLQNRAGGLPSASILSDWKEYSQAKGKLQALAAAHSITAPLQTNANMSTEVLAHSEATLNNTVSDLKKYMYVMKCAQDLQNKATKELHKRIMPHLSLLSNQTRSVAGHHQYSHANRPIQSTSGRGLYDSPYYNAPSAAQRMADAKRIEHILQAEQARRIAERVRSVSRSDGPSFMGSREERREFRG